MLKINNLADKLQKLEISPIAPLIKSLQIVILGHCAGSGYPPVFLCHKFYSTISSHSFHSFRFRSAFDGAAGVVGRHHCYSLTLHIGASSHLISRPGLGSDTSSEDIYVSKWRNEKIKEFGNVRQTVLLHVPPLYSSITLSTHVTSYLIQKSLSFKS